MTSERQVRLIVCLLSITALVLAGPPLVQLTSAQYSPQYSPEYTPVDDISDEDVPAYISVVDGTAELERDGEVSTDIENIPLEAGDRLRTVRGRMELLYNDGSVVAVDERTDLDVVSADALRLQAGRVRIAASRRGFRIDSPAGAALIQAAGDYRVSLNQTRAGELELELGTIRGSAELENALGRTLVRPGTRALTTASYAPSVPYAFNTPSDAFERWALDQDSSRLGTQSVRYLPTELRYYGGTFDRDGSWYRDSVYGWCWYPRVSIGWRPYYGGRWTFVTRFGFSWVGGSRWDWPTHHYGRWENSRDRWFWIPSRPVHARRVGYAVPRSSYNAAPVYFRRTTSHNNGPRAGARSSYSGAGQRPATPSAGQRPATPVYRDGGRPSSGEAGRREPSYGEAQRPSRQVEEPSPRGVERGSRPSISRTPGDRPAPSRPSESGAVRRGESSAPVSRPQPEPGGRAPSVTRSPRPAERERPAPSSSRIERPEMRPAPSMSRPERQTSRPAPSNPRSERPAARQAPTESRPQQSRPAPASRPSQSDRPSRPSVQPAPRSGSRQPSSSATRGGTAVSRRGR